MPPTLSPPLTDVEDAAGAAGIANVTCVAASHRESRLRNRPLAQHDEPVSLANIRPLYLTARRMKELVITHNRQVITPGKNYPMYAAFQRLWALHGTASRYALNIPTEKLLTRPADGVWPQPLMPLAVISPAWGLWVLQAVLSPLATGESEAKLIPKYARWGVRFIGLTPEQLLWPYLNSALFARRLRQAL